VHDRLGPQQVDFEHSDDEETADEEEIFEEQKEYRAKRRVMWRETGLAFADQLSS
jgi:Ran GTPase-activating protein (RanGAP) involved in mRNA processing and transport